MVTPKSMKEDSNPLNIICTFECPFCGEETDVVVSKKAVDDYYNEGRLAQHAFPDLSIDHRELFISGVCANCY